jgi:hypothetical protein
MNSSLHVKFEIWIRSRGPQATWMLFALPETREEAEAIVQERRQRDPLRDYEIREIPE